MPSEQTATILKLNYAYLDEFGAAPVPLEMTRLTGMSPTNGNEDFFRRAEAPFGIFLDWTRYATEEASDRLYLAQASLTKLPTSMSEDLPVPELVTKAGAGDIYDSNLWMGIAPTYTPLHRDPNPNLFVQLAGHKLVRVLSPEIGDTVFGRIQYTLGNKGSAKFRGNEMMKGEEKRLLEAEIWDNSSNSSADRGKGFEAHLSGADGLFIPKGWWHSVKSVGDGISASVNWWFR